MTTATVPIQITCPDWCTRTADEHAAELWDMGGNCIHHSPELFAFDTTGYREPMQEPRFYAPVEVRMTTHTNPEGRESASPVVWVNGHEFSPSQAIALAEIIEQTIESYRAQGGAE